LQGVIRPWRNCDDRRRGNSSLVSRVEGSIFQEDGPDISGADSL